MGKKKKRRSQRAAKPSRQFVVTPSPVVAERDYATAVHAFQRGDYVTAVQLFERVRAVKPESVSAQALAEAHFRCASGCYARADWEQAVYHLDRATRHAPQSPCYWLALGLTNHKRRRLPAAIYAYRQAVEVEAGNARARLLLTLALLEKGELAAAERELEAAVAVRSGDPHRTTGAPLMGLLHGWMALKKGQRVNGSMGQWVNHQPLTINHQPSGVETLLRALSHLTLDETEKAQGLLEQLLPSDRAQEKVLGSGFWVLGLPETQNLKPRTMSLIEACARYYLGLLRLREGDASAAWALWEPAVSTLEAVPSDFCVHAQSALRTLAQEQVRQNHVEEAIRLWERAAALRPTDEEASANLVRACWLLGNRSAEEERLAEAVGWWEKAMQRDPDNVDLAHNLAIALERLGEEQRANQYWETVVRGWENRLASPKARKVALTPSPSPKASGEGGEESPEQADAVHRWKAACKHLGASCGRLGEYGEAAEVYRRLLQRDPQDGEVVRALAEVLTATQRAGEAVRLCEKYLRASPQDVGVWNTLGMLHEQRGEDDKAVRAWEQALAVEPQEPVAQKLLGESLQAQALDWWDAGEPEEALEQLQRAVALLPKNWQARVTMGRIYWEEGDAAKAQESFAEAVRLSDDAARAHALIGSALMEDEEEEEADRWLRTAAEMGGNRIEILLTVGLAYAQARRYQKQARRFLDAAVQLEAEDRRQDLLLSVVMLLMQTDSPLLPSYLKEAQRRCANDPKLHCLLAIYYAGQWDTYRAFRELNTAYELAQQAGDQELMDFVRDMRAMGPLLPFALNMFGLPEMFREFE